ncbi:MAG: hypothetical protein J5767_12425 [Paludibacteraceae bacterium]|nr:hypothetical protein [Paludibacteraceae bacterium]
MGKKEKWKFYDEVFTPLVGKQIEKITGGISLWYEVWIDFEEDILQREEHSNWWNYMMKYPNLASRTAARIMVKWDKWYRSPAYVESLNEMLKNSNI